MCKRGSRPVNRGQKRQHYLSPSASESSLNKESESDDSDEESEESNNEGEHGHHLVEIKKTTTPSQDEGLKKTMTALQEELWGMLLDSERQIKKLQTELSLMKNNSKVSKKSLRVSMRWSGEEINFADSVNTFV